MSPAIRTTHENVRAAQLLLDKYRREWLELNAWMRKYEQQHATTRPETRLVK